LGINRYHDGLKRATYRPECRSMMQLQAFIVAILIAAPSRLHALNDAPVPSEGKNGTEILVMLYLAPQHFRPDADYSGSYGQFGSEARRRIAEDIAGSNGLTVVGGWAMPTIGVDCYVMRSHSNQPVRRVLDSIMRDPRVKWAQPSQTFRTLRYSGPR
jgi:hypothetical protein